MGNIYGYIYAISNEDEEEQRDMLYSLSIPEQNIFVDRLCENSKDRQILCKMERKLCNDDLVYIKNLNMLGDNYYDMLSHWEIITKKKMADVMMLDMPLLDTRQGKEFMESLVRDVIREMLAFVAENEHRKKSKTSIESYLAAKEKGIRYGRPLSPLPDNFEPVYERWKNGELSGIAAAQECGMPLSSFRWRAKRYKEKQENIDTAVNK